MGFLLSSVAKASRNLGLSTSATSKAISIAGAGISQMPGFMASAALLDGSLQEVLQEFRPPDIPFTAIYLDRRLVSSRIRAFMDFLIEITQPHPGPSGTSNFQNC